MTGTTDTATLLARLCGSGLRLWPENGAIHYRSPKALSPEVRDAILANKPALLTRLAEWDAAEASRLQFEADGLVCELGVSGLDPEIQRAAILCVEAHHHEVMAGVRKGCALIEDRARKLAAQKSRPGVRAA